MKTYSIFTLGCKVNQYESQQVRQLLNDHHLVPAKGTGSPDLVVVNTCCVTHCASAKSRQAIHRLRRKNPNSAIVIIGCLPTITSEQIRHPDDLMYTIVNRDEIPSALHEIVQKNGFSRPESKSTSIKAENRPKIKPKNLTNSPKLLCLTSFEGQTRAFVKAQDGCDAYCTYCIIPTTRPDVCSRGQNDILNEVQALIEAGHKEIVITGVFLGAYGKKTARRKKWDAPCNEKFVQLIEKIAQVPGLKRLRLSSLEPGDITPELVSLFKQYPNLMPHFHLSLQSGSDKILRKMGRQYRSHEFLEKVNLIRSLIDIPAITTDIIVGFPSETEDDFEATRKFAEQIGFSRMHVFPYSTRKGTACANMPEQVPEHVKKKRSIILHELDRHLQYQFRQQFIGSHVHVLIESVSNTAKGYTQRYFTVEIRNPDTIQKNDLMIAEIIDNIDHAAIARMIEKIED